MSPRVLRGLLLAGLGLTLIGAMLLRGIERLIFYPTPGVDVRPEQIGVPVDEVYFETEDGVRIHAYWLPNPDAPRALLFLMGNAGNASRRLPNAALLRELGVSVLLLDYRGYGLSEGTPSELGVQADARAALAELGRRGFAPERVVLFGRSLGGAVAVELARDRPLAGVILESTFTSASDVANSVLPPLGFLLRGRLRSDLAIASLRAPVLFFHGDRDRTIPIELGRRLYELAPEPKRFVVLAGAGHDDTVRVGGRAYLDEIRSFIAP